MSDREYLDTLLEQVAYERALRGPDPDLDRIWERIAEEIRARRRARKWRTAVAVGAALFFCFGMVGIFWPEPVKATGRMVWYFLSGTNRETITVTLTLNDGGRTRDKSSEVRLHEIRKKCPFPVRVPAYIPPRFELAVIHYMPRGTGGELILYYEADPGFLVFTQRYDNDSGSYICETSDALIKEQVSLRGVPAQLTYNKEQNQVALTWAEGDVTYHLGGTLSPSEALRIARSIS